MPEICKTEQNPANVTQHRIFRKKFFQKIFLKKSAEMLVRTEFFAKFFSQIFSKFFLQDRPKSNIVKNFLQIFFRKFYKNFRIKFFTNFFQKIFGRYTASHFLIFSSRMNLKESPETPSVMMLMMKILTKIILA